MSETAFDFQFGSRLRLKFKGNARFLKPSLALGGLSVRCRVDVEAADHHGWTALLHACRNDMKEAFQNNVSC